MFSKSCEYGIKAIVFIASKSLIGERTSLKEIAERIDSPVAFTAKILQQLSKNDLIHSVKGPFGGFEIPKESLKDISLIQVVETIDGDKLFKGCGLGLRECNAHKPCPLHDKFLGIRNDLTKMLQETNLEELSVKIDEGLNFLKR